MKSCEHHKNEAELLESWQDGLPFPCVSVPLGPMLYLCTLYFQINYFFLMLCRHRALEIYVMSTMVLSSAIPLKLTLLGKIETIFPLCMCDGKIKYSFVPSAYGYPLLRFPAFCNACFDYFHLCLYLLYSAFAEMTHLKLCMCVCLWTEI